MSDYIQWYRLHSIFEGRKGDAIAYSPDTEKLKTFGSENWETQGGRPLVWEEDAAHGEWTARAMENLQFVIAPEYGMVAFLI